MSPQLMTASYTNKSSYAFGTKSREPREDESLISALSITNNYQSLTKRSLPLKQSRVLTSRYVTENTRRWKKKAYAGRKRTEGEKEER